MAPTALKRHFPAPKEKGNLGSALIVGHNTATHDQCPIEAFLEDLPP
jgi:hypothetical protein